MGSLPGHLLGIRLNLQICGCIQFGIGGNTSLIMDFRSTLVDLRHLTLQVALEYEIYLSMQLLKNPYFPASHLVPAHHQPLRIISIALEDLICEFIGPLRASFGQPPHLQLPGLHSIKGLNTLFFGPNYM